MRLSRCCCFVRISGYLQQHQTAISSNAAPKLTPPTTDRNGNLVKKLANNVVTYYEECLGLTDVHRARDEVNQVKRKKNWQ